MDAATLEADVVRVVNKLRDALLRRGTLNLAALREHFVAADADGDQQLSQRELAALMARMGLFLAREEFNCLFRALDKDQSGLVSAAEFVGTLRGHMSERRRALVRRVFDMIDAGGKGFVSVRDVRAAFDAMGDPRVARGEVGADRALEDLLRGFEQAAPADGAGAGRVSRTAFEQFYADVSARTRADADFVRAIEGTWKLQETVEEAERLNELQTLIYDRIIAKARATETVEEAGRRLFKFQDLSDQGVLDRRGFMAAMTVLGVGSEAALLGHLFDRHNTNDLIDYHDFLRAIQPSV